jgi:3D (Asp-Asp-Asp) domain-containing protein
MYVPVGRTTLVKTAVTGRDEALPNIYVRLHGRGIDQNGVSDADGLVSFSVLPTSTGNISIDVGEENRTIEDVIIVTSWIIDASTDSTTVDEGNTFTVTAIREGTTTAIEDASVTFNGVTQTTDENGQTTFTAPTVTSDRTFTITVTATGYAPDPEGLTITVINIPQLIISIPTEVCTGSTFDVAVANDVGSAIIGATVTFEGSTYTTGVGGVATLTAPSTAGDYAITATFGTFVAASDTVTVTVCGIPGFELLALIAAIGVAFILLRRRRH